MQPELIKFLEFERREILGDHQNLRTYLNAVEREKILLALAKGKTVYRAAQILGLTHQGLWFILNGRHQGLVDFQRPKRKKSIIQK